MHEIGKTRNWILPLIGLAIAGLGLSAILLREAIILAQLDAALTSAQHANVLLQESRLNELRAAPDYLTWPGLILLCVGAVWFIRVTWHSYHYSLETPKDKGLE